ncbi:transglycosylase family protein [Kitasatospora sp. NPDC059795]|uniref:transglycosylase family protein n=1 Tax=Kitasatospora sp. NPDC059795 TaxID=3346949 RepID=UPI003667B09B
MIFRNETAAAKTATTTAAEGSSTRKRVRAAIVVGSAMAVLPVAGLVTATSAHAADVSTWDKVAQCESTGNWSIDSGNGFYGGLQFTSSTWAAYGGTAYAPQANQATKAQQIAVAEKVLASQGPGAWPVCSVKAGLTKGGTAAQVDTSASATTATASTATTSTATANNAATKSVKLATTKSDAASTNTTAGNTATPQVVKAQGTSSDAKTVKVDKAQVDKAQGEKSWTKHNAKAAGGNYTVKSGDTLSAIAAANGTTVDALFQANAKTIGASADVIFPGQVLSV